MKPYYDHSGITIYHGDCREVLPTLASKSYDAVITDPPFSIPVKYQDSDAAYPRSWGDLAVMEPFFSEVLKEIRRVVSDTGQTYVCCDGDTYPIFFRVAYSLWTRSHLLVWYKPTGRRGLGWMHAHELLLHLHTPAAEYAAGFRQDVFGVMPVRTLNREHPAEKPGDLWSFVGGALPARDRPAELLDPFMGAGGLLTYAKTRGMHAIGIEIEERYCEIAARRLEQEVLPLVSVPKKAPAKQTDLPLRDVDGVSTG